MVAVVLLFKLRKAYLLPFSMWWLSKLSLKNSLPFILFGLVNQIVCSKSSIISFCVKKGHSIWLICSESFYFKFVWLRGKADIDYYLLIKQFHCCCSCNLGERCV